MSWFLVGILALIVAVTWIANITATIVEPVAVGGIVAIVAAPLVDWLQRHHVKRGLGAAIVVLSLIALVVVVVGLVIGGINDHSGEIKSTINKGGDHIEALVPRRRREPHRADETEHQPRGLVRRDDAPPGPRGGDQEPDVADLLHHLHGLCALLPAHGRAGDPPVGRPAHGLTGRAREPDHRQRDGRDAQVLPRRDDGRGLQRRGGRDRGADPRRPARGHDRARHLRDRVHPVHRRVHLGRLRRAARPRLSRARTRR